MLYTEMCRQFKKCYGTTGITLTTVLTLDIQELTFIILFFSSRCGRNGYEEKQKTIIPEIMKSSIDTYVSIINYFLVA